MAEAGHAVYVHWPFCLAKCPYCDFNSHVRHGGPDEAQFVAAMLRELAHQREISRGDPVDSIFFGGGTPSLMSADAVGTILDGIAGLWPVSQTAEVTLEANPSSVEAERFSGYRAAGINRVSLGIQALNDPDLRALGRLHSLAEAKTALAIAFNTFDRVSFDLIYARPGQTCGQWRAELSEALRLGASHMSLYQLTIEEGTPFAALHAAGKLITPAEADAADLFEITQELTETAGLPAYEISNHARPGEECRHNLVYWRYGTYAGIGPGAHGRLLTADGRRLALANERSPERWRDLAMRQGHGSVECTALRPHQQIDEMLLMGLRTRDGVATAHLASLLAQPPDLAALAPLVGAGLIEQDDHVIRATAAGRPVLNRLVLEVAALLVPSTSSGSPADGVKARSIDPDRQQRAATVLGTAPNPDRA
ncbi:MAG: radical SAM family heme chaperone HemW [Hyphomicrobiaceae bacterium]